MSIRVFLVAMFCALLQQSLAAGEVWESKRGLFAVSFESELQPIEINQIHNWTLHIETTSGDPVAGAGIEVTGGMPLHNHGLPTRPLVTEELGDGNYRLEGMRFHMAGDWQLTITIVADGRTDTVIVRLQL
jgi:hypothetical protein